MQERPIVEIPDKKADPRETHFHELISGLTRSIAHCPSVIAIILYGSAARMRTTPLSDLDICVVTCPGISHDEWEGIMSHSGPALDLVLFHDLSPQVRYRVVRDGIILCNQDPKALHRIKAEALRQYLDLKPFIDRNARRILKKTVPFP
jgi:predicted nucleotidyltransferase